MFISSTLAENMHMIEVSGKLYRLPSPLVYTHSVKGGYHYKYLVDIDKKEISYWVSTGSAWGENSRIKILLIINEGKIIDGIPVFSVYYAPQNPMNKLYISTDWNKMISNSKIWFNIKTK
jgi:hypothetical protein